MAIVLDTEYDFGDIVYVLTDPEQKPRLVTAICLRPQGYIQYELCCGDSYTWHIGTVLCRNKNVLLSN